MVVQTVVVLANCLTQRIHPVDRAVIAVRQFAKISHGSVLKERAMRNCLSGRVSCDNSVLVNIESLAVAPTGEAAEVRHDAIQVGESVALKALTPRCSGDLP